MAEFCLPNRITPRKKAGYESESTSFSTFVLSGLYLLCSALISHPLYFFYFIFFSPYLLKLLSFLSPLFITTALLLLLAFLTVSPGAAYDELSHSNSLMKMLFLRADIAIRAVVEKLRWIEPQEEGDEEGSHHLVRTVLEEEVEVYRIVFEVTEIPVREEALEDDCSPPIQRSSETLTRDLGEIPRESEELLEEKEIWCDTASFRAVEEEEKVIEIAESQGEVKRSRSASTAANINNQTSEATAAVHNARAIEEKLEMVTSKDEKSWNPCTNLVSSGSMRKEKEWKRTLACKLFEERHNNGSEGGTEEGMDSLWETYETTDLNKLQNRSRKGTKAETKKKTKNHYAAFEEEEEEDDDDDDDDDDGDAAKLCCLQALKFSAGKMNMGMGMMGRPGFVKISKAFKGIGWLHSPARHHAKKTSFI